MTKVGPFYCSAAPTGGDKKAEKGRDVSGEKGKVHIRNSNVT